MVVGPVAAALVLLTGFLFTTLWSPGDDSPPQQPVLSSPRLVEDEEPPRLEFDYEGADDDRGIAAVELWYRLGREGRWAATSERRTGSRGLLKFENLEASGVYFFDAVTTDHAGNASHDPEGTNGQHDYGFVAAADRADPSAVVNVLAADEGEEDLQTRLRAFYDANRDQLEADPEVKARYDGAISRLGELAVRQPREPVRDGDKLAQFTAANPTFVRDLGEVEIPVAFHLIHDGDDGFVGDDRVRRQLAILDRAFAPARIRFSLASVRRHDNPEWYPLEAFSATERALKAELQVDPRTALNVYVTAIRQGSTEIGEYTYRPDKLAAAPQMDGVVLHHKWFAGAGGAVADGKTLVHGVGHWLGLLHTFEGGCEGPNDYVDDTPAHPGPNFATDQGAPACKPGERPPVDNYMNFSASPSEFTPGQIERMKAALAVYRRELLPVT